VPLRDFLPRRVCVEVAGREFVVRPITLAGALAANAILQRWNTRLAESDLRRIFEPITSAKDGTEARAAGVVRAWLDLLSELNLGDLAELLALICEPADPSLIRLAMESEPITAPAAFLHAAADLHDFPRIVRFLTPPAEASPMLPVGEGGATYGQETIILQIIHELPSYRVEDVLDWPLERVISVVEQLRLIRLLAEQPPPRATRPTSDANLTLAGIHIHRRPRGAKPN